MDMVRFSARPLGYLSAVLICLPLLVGCPTGNEDAAHLAGTVTVGGEPFPTDVDQAMITFVPVRDQGRGQAAQANIVDGRFDVPNAPVGQVTISVVANKITGTVTDERGSYDKYETVLPPGTQTTKTITVEGDDTDMTLEF